jgi:hypothetical protein
MPTGRLQLPLSVATVRSWLQHRLQRLRQRLLLPQRQLLQQLLPQRQRQRRSPLLRLPTQLKHFLTLTKLC